jgi:hypothetical protein
MLVGDELCAHMGLLSLTHGSALWAAISMDMAIIGHAILARMTLQG